MSLFKIKGIIAELGSTGSSNNKKDILAKYKDDADWIKFLSYTHDEVKYTYGKSKLPIIPMVPTIKLENDAIADEGLMETLYEVLDLMIVRDLTGYGLNAIRVTIGTNDHNTKLFKLLDEVLYMHSVTYGWKPVEKGVANKYFWIELLKTEA